MILVINTCKEKLHFHEFVKPVGNVLINHGIQGFIRHYTCLRKKDIEKADNIIICGTSLKDNEFVENVEKFKWILDYEKPILGICGGMQIIGLLYGGTLKNKTEIGFYTEDFRKDFLGHMGKHEVYHLHNNYVDFSTIKEFEVYAGKKVSQAVKHTEKEVYGVLFHPEVRNKELIQNFIA